MHGEAFNFGPRAEQNRTVVQLLEELSRHWGFADTERAYQITDQIPFHEASLLKLNCDKALFHLKWEANLDYVDCVKFIADWYIAFYRDKADMFALTLEQISAYERIAIERGRMWCAGS